MSSEEIGGTGTMSQPVDITLQNQKRSPLLRLPAEIREMIWVYAFGNRALHPISNRKVGPAKRIRFYPCREQLSDTEIYKLTRLGAKKGDECAWGADRLYMHPGVDDRLAGMHNCVGEGWPVVPFLHEAVICRQIWAEAFHLLWKSTTFCFENDHDFLHFTDQAVKPRAVSLNQDTTAGDDNAAPIPPVELIKEITLLVRDIWKGWRFSFNSYKYDGRYQGLIGVHLILEYDGFYLSGSKPGWEWPSDKSNRPRSLYKKYIPFGLREDRTTVWIIGHYPVQRGDDQPWYKKLTIAQRLELADIVKGYVLGYVPKKN